MLLWELLTGTPPYAGDKPLSVAYRHVHEDVPPPSSAVGGIPPVLDDLVVRATRRDPEQRPADAGEFLSELVAIKPMLPDVPPEAVSEHQTLIVPRRGPATPKPRRTGRRALVALVVLALLALGGGYYLGSYRYTDAPSVLDLTLAQATHTLDGDGLHVRQGDAEYSETVPKGQVVSQQPGPHGRVRKGGTVTVHLSRGPDRRVVPRVTGKSVADASAALVDVGLEVAAARKSEYSQSVAKGLVIRTDPAVGERLKPGTEVTLVVSKGKEPVDVPNVTGQKQDRATKTLHDLGFVVAVQQVFSDNVPIGVVVDQTPSAGTADKGSTVTLSVSKGPDIVQVPDVRGMNHDEAKRVLEGDGFVVKEVVYLPGGPGDVLTTDPKPGKKVKRGSTVTVYYY